MIRCWAFRYTAVALVALISGIIFWQVNGDKSRPFIQKAQADHHDTYIIGAHYHNTDKNGQLHEELQVNSAKHYPHQNTAILYEPQLKIHGPHGETWHIHATQGTSTQGRDTVVLRDNVKIEHRSKVGAPPVVVSMESLTVHPGTKTADTDSLVTITYPQIVLQGKGLHGDLKAGTLKLLTQIRGHYEPIAGPTPAARTESKLRAAL